MNAPPASQPVLAQRLNASVWRPQTAMITMRGLLSCPGQGLPTGLPMITVALTSLGFCSLALVGSAFSALALYAASPHCRWPRLRRAGRLGRQISLVAAVAALWLWIANLGIATGVVVMLCSWMLVAIALPLLAAWHRPAQVMR